MTNIGEVLRYWRGERRMSQLDLALSANVSSRHISFVETGRSEPSREMVLRLAQVLELPLREQNALLQAAGYAPVYPERELVDDRLAPIRAALGKVLERHAPYPALVLDRHWNLVMANSAATNMMLRLLPPAYLAAHVPLNTVKVLFDSNGLRPYLENWEKVAAAVIQQVHRERLCGLSDAVTDQLLDELRAMPDVPETLHQVDLGATLDPVMTVTFVKDDLRLEMFSLLATLGTPNDVTLQELRIETWFPADDATDLALHRLATEV